MISVPKNDLTLMLEAGYIYMGMRRFSEAKQIFEGLVALSPKHEIPRVALANSFFAQEKYLQAIRVLKDARKINTDSAFVHAHLGEAYLFYGKKEEATESLNKAVELDSQGNAGQFAKSLLDLIDQGYDPQQYKEEAKNKSKNS